MTLFGSAVVSWLKIQNVFGDFGVVWKGTFGISNIYSRILALSYVDRQDFGKDLVQRLAFIRYLAVVDRWQYI